MNLHGISSISLGEISPERVLSLVIRWLFLAASVWFAADLISGIHLDGAPSTLGVALVLGLLNISARPLLRQLTMPVTLLTFGLFLVIINAGLLLATSWLAGHSDELQFHVDNYISAILGALVISTVSLILRSLINPERIADRVIYHY